jgi:hypothetical protein
VSVPHSTVDRCSSSPASAPETARHRPRFSADVAASIHNNRWLLGVAVVVVGVSVWVMLQPGPIDLGVVRIATRPGWLLWVIRSSTRSAPSRPPGLPHLVRSVGGLCPGPVVRGRRAGPIERQQLKWRAFVAGGTGLAGATGFLLAGFGNRDWRVAGRGRPDDAANPGLGVAPRIPTPTDLANPLGTLARRPRLGRR